jgi:hypothetical protein
VGPDLATGSGLVDAHKAVMVAKVQCLGPIVGPITVQPITGPITPITGPVTPITGPVTPITGPITPITGPITPITGPVRPVTPVQPITGPIRPVTPVQPIQPGPITPIQPIRPIAPIVNPGPIQPAAGEGPGSTNERAFGGAQSSLSAQDVQTLSDLIIKSEIDLG